MFEYNAPSKINLFLSIERKREDGYHDIKTIFVTLPDIRDEIDIEFDTESGINISTDNKNIPLDESNLCWKAAALYYEAAGIEPHLKINIKKRIPVAAGMGGGSSNAAAVLNLLEKKHSLIDIGRLQYIALSIGADVPYFLDPFPAVAEGVGEKIKKFKLAKGAYAVIVAPCFPISASWAYRNYKSSSSVEKTSMNDLISDLVVGDWSNASGLIYNDLEYAACQKFPIIHEIKSELLSSGALNANMTGSGPTVFGLCNDRKHAGNVLSKIKPEFKNNFYCKMSRVE